MCVCAEGEMCEWLGVLLLESVLVGCGRNGAQGLVMAGQLVLVF